LIGTTDKEHNDLSVKPTATDEEQDYLCAFASQYFEKPVTRDDIVWTYSGVRPLYDDGAKSATAATRDYVLSVDDNGPPLLNVFGGKITTYRKLAENALSKLAAYHDMTAAWTATAPMPGGDFEVRDRDRLVSDLQVAFPYLDPVWAMRLIKAYGTDAAIMLEGTTAIDDLGVAYGATLTGIEVDWLMQHEFARNADDVVWRRSKLGLRMTASEIATLDRDMKAIQPA
jgi:glycerol-3-phosphate dehydrogenase